MAGVSPVSQYSLFLFLLVTHSLCLILLSVGSSSAYNGSALVHKAQSRVSVAQASTVVSNSLSY